MLLSISFPEFRVSVLFQHHLEQDFFFKGRLFEGMLAFAIHYLYEAGQ